MYAVLGNVVIIQNFPTSHQDPSMSSSKQQVTGERECIFIPLKIAKRKRYKNAVDGVVLAAIQIVEDPI